MEKERNREERKEERGEEEREKDRERGIREVVENREKRAAQENRMNIIYKTKHDNNRLSLISKPVSF